ncbi:hypothetical protein ILUMI_22174 [Ignelater luminosus]|uniref:Uncharacterized protein n=1 Tax=Ignelater luminosus TaxID=2038154 RepID=A0A8K0CAM9_IGNLU|nr:hypothetical protein ILUMI_22174 [Ignelater luminosus]
MVIITGQAISIDNPLIKKLMEVQPEVKNVKKGMLIAGRVERIGSKNYITDEEGQTEENKRRIYLAGINELDTDQDRLTKLLYTLKKIKQRMREIGLKITIINAIEENDTNGI